MFISLYFVRNLPILLNLNSILISLIEKSNGLISPYLYDIIHFEFETLVVLFFGFS